MVAIANQAGVGLKDTYLASDIDKHRVALSRKNHNLIHDITTDIEYTSRINEAEAFVIALGYDPAISIEEEKSIQ